MVFAVFLEFEIILRICFLFERDLIEREGLI